MNCTIVDVFAEQPLAGNQLAVARDCGDLDAATMQAIAHELNFSETTFVTEERGGRATVRIFTPTRELPFAGHPTLGTAWVLASGADRYTLDLKVGAVAVTFEDGIAWMTAPDVEFGDVVAGTTAAALLGLEEADLDVSVPARFAAIGPRFVLVGTKTMAALRRARVNAEVHATLMSPGDFLGVFAFAPPGYSADADFAARMFFDANGWREDPATGSATSAFAAYLRLHGKRGNAIVEQGFEMDRPSRLYLDIGDSIRVGGKVQPVLTGRFEI